VNWNGLLILLVAVLAFILWVFVSAARAVGWDT
jgi:hypothetical protein